MFLLIIIIFFHANAHISETSKPRGNPHCSKFFLKIVFCFQQTLYLFSQFFLKIPTLIPTLPNKRYFLWDPPYAEGPTWRSSPDYHESHNRWIRYSGNPRPHKSVHLQRGRAKSLRDASGEHKKRPSLVDRSPQLVFVF